MAKSGQARVLSPAQKERLFVEITKRRHPEKNAAIMHINFHLGLRSQEISLLRIKEVAWLTRNLHPLKILYLRTKTDQRSGQ